MAKVRILGNDELSQVLKFKFKEAKKVMDRLTIELEACRNIYQGITDWSEGGLDSGLLTQALFQPSQGENSSQPIEGLDLIKAVLFLHSKMCVSEPVVTCNPLNQDMVNKEAAEYAQNYIPYFKKHTMLQEKLEKGPYLGISVDGNGVMYIGWDDNGGEFPFDDIPDNADITKIDFKMEGDYEVRTVPVRKFYLDANAMHGLIDAEHCFEERDVLFEKALFIFDKPEEQEIIKAEHDKARQASENNEISEDRKVSTVQIYEYWEKGSPWNGFLGAHVFFVNPAEPKIIRRENHPYKHKRLPYAMMTDIDIPNNSYGMSRIIYAWQVQKSIDTILSLIMDNIALHGSAKFYTPEGATNEDGTDNDPASIGTYNPSSGGQPIQFRPANVTSDVWRGYEILRDSINNIYGMNEFSQGQIPRELSSYAVQLALEMDDKYRIRLFNKKKQFLKDIYWMGIELTKQFMNDQRKMNIVGIESFSGDDYFEATKLEGDYSIDVDYGQYIPVDPAARKQQLLEFIKSGFFEKAGGDMKKVAPLLIDGSMLDVKNMFEKAAKIQKTEIAKIIEGEKVSIRKWDNHEAHAKAVDEYVNSETFEALEDHIKEAIWAHGEAHTQALAVQLAKANATKGGGQNQPGAGPGMPPGPGGGAGDPFSTETPETGKPDLPKETPPEITQTSGPIT